LRWEKLFALFLNKNKLRWQKLTYSKRKTISPKNSNNLRKNNVKCDVYVHSGLLHLKNLWQNLLTFYWKFTKYGQNP